MLKTRKPIMCCEQENNGFSYKYVRIGYAMGVPIKFKTDLNKAQWSRLLDGENGGFFSQEEIDRFETTGSFKAA